MDAEPLIQSVHALVERGPEPTGPSIGSVPVASGEPEPLEADQFHVYIFPTGRTFYEFGSEAVARRFFGERIVASKEDLRAVISELIAEAPRPEAPRGVRARAAPVDRNLITTREFAEVVDCAESSVFEMLKLGLPSIKSPKLGRRILKTEALAWLQAGGASRSRTAKRLRKTSGGSRGT